MNPEDHIGHSVRVNYEIDGEQHSRTGVLTAVSLKRASVLLFVDDDADDEEVSIPIKGIKRIYRLKV